MLGSIWAIGKETIEDYMEDNALSRGAAIAYFTIFSIAPILVICIAIAGLVFGQEAAQGAMVGQLQGLMGDQGAQAIQAMVASAGNKSSGIWATIIGIVTLLITATGVLGEMQSALNEIWKAKAPAGLTGMLKARATGLGLVATLGFLLLVSLVVSAGLSALGHYLNSFIPEIGTILQIANFLISFVLVSALFAAIYKILPDRKLKWKDVIVGAVATSLLFTIGKTLIGLYIGNSSVASSYGAAGALVIVLLWVYYSSQIFLLGAEFTKVWASHQGSPEAFAARNDQPAAPTPAAAPATAVQTMIAHTAARKTSIGVFEIAALGTLLLVAYQGHNRR